jgi:hypothetical protein
MADASTDSAMVSHEVHGSCQLPMESLGVLFRELQLHAVGAHAMIRAQALTHAHKVVDIIPPLAGPGVGLRRRPLTVLPGSEQVVAHLQVTGSTAHLRAAGLHSDAVAQKQSYILCRAPRLFRS